MTSTIAADPGAGLLPPTNAKGADAAIVTDAIEEAVFLTTASLTDSTLKPHDPH